MRFSRGVLPRTGSRGWWISATLHGGLLLAILQLGRDSDPPSTWIAVDLVTPAEPSADREFAIAPRRIAPPLHTGLRAPTTRLIPLPDIPPPSTLETRSRILFDRVATPWWNEHSLAEWIEDCRAGQSIRDSTLERPRTIQEQGRERTVASLNREFRTHRWEWELERFHEAYVRNFPLMR